MAVKKALEIADEVVAEWPQTVDPNGNAMLELKNSIQDEADHYFGKRSAGKVRIEASNPLAAVYGASQLKAGISSGYLAEFLGGRRASFPLRPLWIKCEKHVSITEKVGLYLPNFFIEKKKAVFELFCRRCIELGFNAVILGMRGFCFEHKSSVAFPELDILAEMLHEYGIKLLVKPVIYYLPDEEGFPRIPQGKIFCQKICEGLADLFQKAPALDALFWECHYQHSDFLYHPRGNEMSKLEKTLAELKLIEGTIPEGVNLLYYLPCEGTKMAKQQGQWLAPLLDEAGPATTIVFSTVSGDPIHDHESPHPFWHLLRASPDVSATPLLPIINVGGVGVGEGLWPGVSLDLLDDFFHRAERHPFAGFIALTPHIPRKGSLLDCALWVAGQLLWQRGAPYHVVESWFAMHLPEEDFSSCLEMFKLTRLVVKKLSLLRSLVPERCRDKVSGEECRALAEAILGMLKIIEFRMVAKGSAELKEYYIFFIRDAKRIVYHGLQCYGLSVTHPLGEEGAKEAFWTELSDGIGEGVRSSAKITFLKSPSIGEAGSARHKIFWKSRIDS